MDDNKLRALASQSPIDPITTAPSSVILSSQHLACSSITFWWKQAPPIEWYLPPLTHHVVAVQLQAGSRLVQARDGRRYEGPWYRGEAVIGQAGQPAFWRTEGSNNLQIALAPSLLQRVALEACNMDPDRVELRDVFNTNDAILKSIALALWTELKVGCIGGQLYAELLGTMLATHLLRTYCTQRPVLKLYKGGLPQHRLQRVVEYIDAHLAQPLTLSELAGLLEISEAHFIRAFRRSTGYTPHQYVIRCRIERAKVLLSDSAVPIGAIASRVGFQTHSHFAMLFRKLTGLSPIDYHNARFTP